MNFLLAGLFVVFANSSLAASNRFRLFDHSDAARKLGFFVSLENETTGDALPLESLRLHVSVGDGERWRRIDVARQFRADEAVTVRIAIDARGASVLLDRLPAGTSPGRFVAAKSGQASVAETEKSAKGFTPYRIEQGAYRVSIDDHVIAGEVKPAVTGQLALFEFPLGQTVPMPAGEFSAIVVETSFRIVALAPAQYIGAVDRYGQAAGGDWPGKVHSDEDLRRSRSDELQRTEAWVRPVDWDVHGGLTAAPWHEQSTGFYRVTKRDGKWWLVSAEGNPLFYTGLCVAPSLIWSLTPVEGREQVWQELPPKSGATAGLWEDDPWGNGEHDNFSPHAWNLLRKYGRDWKRLAVEDCSRRMNAWGFSGLGKFCDRDDVPGKPRVETIKLGKKVVPLVRHIDVFDPAACAALRKYLDAAVGSGRTDPRILGFSVGNEYDEIFTTDEIRMVLSSHPQSQVALAIRSALTISAKPTEMEIERARQFYAEAYYAFIYRTMKELAPNHLYFGFWITPGWWQNEADWDMIARHCDVIGYDKYALQYGGEDGLVTRLIAKNDKPTIVGEFSFPAWYGGARGFTRYNTYVETDREAGEFYAAYVKAAAADPRCVGAMWFQYRDEPVTGWGGEGERTSLVRGESHAEGLVDVADQPKWDLVTRVREANLNLTRDRLRR